MNKQDYYFEQLVLENDLDTLQENIEAADRALCVDFGVRGVVAGFAGSEHTPVPDLSVDISGPGRAYDQNGRRIFMPTTVTLDLSVDSNNASTAVVEDNHEKWLSVFVEFTRFESDVRVDGNGATVNYRQDEGYQFIVVQGAEAPSGTAARPTLISGAVLLFDVLLERETESPTQILDDNIDDSRKQWAFIVSGDPVSLRAGSFTEAAEAMVDELNAHINDLGNSHPASSVTFDGAFAEDGIFTDLVAAQTVQEAIEAIVSFPDLEGVFGDGSDGDLDVGSNFVELERDMFYNNFTVGNGGWIQTNGFRIFVRGTCHFQSGSAVDNSGGDGGNGSGGSQGAAGAGPPAGSILNGADGAAGEASGVQNHGTNAPAHGVGTIGLGGIGGAGGNAGSSNGGAGGALSSTATSDHAYGLFRRVPHAIEGVASCVVSGSAVTARARGGTGGGSGATGGLAGSSGAGGGSGGLIIINARRFINQGFISAVGGRGGNGGGSNQVGGGGGGGGGAVLINTRHYTHTGTIDVSGGNGGNGSGGGQNGSPGEDGIVQVLVF